MTWRSTTRKFCQALHVGCCVGARAMFYHMKFQFYHVLLFEKNAFKFNRIINAFAVLRMINQLKVLHRLINEQNCLRQKK